MNGNRLRLAPPERKELKRRARSRSLAAESVKRARLILLLAGGHSYSNLLFKNSVFAASCCSLVSSVLLLLGPKRHGTLSLYAALNIQTGEVLGKTTARHTSTEFVEFLGQVVASQP